MDAGEACSFPWQLLLSIVWLKDKDDGSDRPITLLAVLAAMRAWKHRWLHQRVFVKVKSDSISALVLMFKLKTSGYGAGIIAREVALDLAQSEYYPNVVQHVPGIDNVIADELSRKHQPGHTYVMPACLTNVQEIKLPSRTTQFYRSTRPPVTA